MINNHFTFDLVLNSISSLKCQVYCRFRLTSDGRGLVLRKGCDLSHIRIHCELKTGQIYTKTKKEQISRLVCSLGSMRKCAFYKIIIFLVIITMVTGITTDAMSQTMVGFPTVTSQVVGDPFYQDAECPV